MTSEIVPEENSEVVITIDPEETSETPVVEDNSMVIVEESSDSTDAVDAVVIDHAIDTAERLAFLEAENARLAAELQNVSFQADNAEFLAEVALDETANLAAADEEIIDATDEAIVESIEGAEIEEGGFGEEDEIVTDEIAPVSARVHPIFRSFSDWKAGS